MLPIARLRPLSPSSLVRRFLFLILLLLFPACDDEEGGGTIPPPPQNLAVGIERVFPAVGFANPVDLQGPPDGTGRLFVVEKGGRIRFLDPSDSTRAPVFLDISARVDSTGGEMGLLGLAFHPGYPDPPYLYVYYTASGRSGLRGKLARFRADPGGDSADPNSEAVLLEIPQPYTNHNGGGVCFGRDTQLFLGLGDGGSGGDPDENGQDRRTLLGSILRLDVGIDPDTPPYHGIPADNPFVGGSEGFAAEIYAYGLRNPWRISFDPVTGELWAADVGQSRWEEVNLVAPGGNHGWDCREGFEAYMPPPGGSSPACPTAGPFIDPVHAYAHSDGNASVTGGHVYRGNEIAQLRGRYLFADYVSGRVWSMEQDGSDLKLVADTGHYISSFGVDASGESYLLAYGSPGGVYRFFARPAPESE